MKPAYWKKSVWMSSMKHKYALIGEKLGHSFSVPIHNAFGNDDYTLTEIPKEELSFRKLEFLFRNETYILSEITKLKQQIKSLKVLDSFGRIMYITNVIGLKASMEESKEDVLPYLIDLARKHPEIEEWERNLKDEKIDCWDPSWKKDFLAWLENPEILVMKKGKKTEKEINIRPLIYEARFAGSDLILGLSAGLDRNIRPELVMKAFAEQTGRQFVPSMFRINRDEVYADLCKEGNHRFVSLISMGEIIS